MKLLKRHVAWLFSVGYKITHRADMEITHQDMIDIEEEFEELYTGLDDKYADPVDMLGFGIRYSSAPDYNDRLRDLWEVLPESLRPAVSTLCRQADDAYVYLITGLRREEK